MTGLNWHSTAYGPAHTRKGECKDQSAYKKELLDRAGFESTKLVAGQVSYNGETLGGHNVAVVEAEGSSYVLDLNMQEPAVLYQGPGGPTDLRYTGTDPETGEPRTAQMTVETIYDQGGAWMRADMATDAMVGPIPLDGWSKAMGLPEAPPPDSAPTGELRRSR